jgi:REP element-mobilizing transposase RayT
LFLKIFDQVRQKYELAVIGYVVMPEHFHLLIGEPDDGNVAVAIQVLKQRVAAVPCQGPLSPAERRSSCGILVPARL